MKKYLSIAALCVFVSPALASTVNFINAFQCRCTSNNKQQLTCKKSDDKQTVYVGYLKNGLFSPFGIPTAKVQPGQATKALISQQDKQPCIAFSTLDKTTDLYSWANLSDYSNYSSLTLMHYHDSSTPSVGLMVESRCLNPVSCVYNNSLPDCNS